MATRNPIPSEAPEDLKFNAGKIDEEVNSDAEYYVDRFDKRRFTNEGRNKLAERQRDTWDSRFQSIAAQYGWRQVPYVAGNVLELRTDYVEIAGEGGYSLNYDVPLPYTLTGDWATESVNFTRMSDATLRADLADPDKGARIVYLDNGTVYDAVNYITPEMFGAIGDGVEDDTAALLAFGLFYHNNKQARGDYKVSSTVVFEIARDSNIIDLAGSTFIMDSGEIVLSFICDIHSEFLGLYLGAFDGKGEVNIYARVWGEGSCDTILVKGDGQYIKNLSNKNNTASTSAVRVSLENRVTIVDGVKANDLRNINGIESITAAQAVAVSGTYGFGIVKNCYIKGVYSRTGYDADSIAVFTRDRLTDPNDKAIFYVHDNILEDSDGRFIKTQGNAIVTRNYMTLPSTSEETRIQSGWRAVDILYGVGDVFNNKITIEGSGGLNETGDNVFAYIQNTNVKNIDSVVRNNILNGYITYFAMHKGNGGGDIEVIDNIIGSCDTILYVTSADNYPSIFVESNKIKKTPPRGEVFAFTTVRKSPSKVISVADNTIEDGGVLRFFSLVISNFPNYTSLRIEGASSPEIPIDINKLLPGSVFYYTTDGTSTGGLINVPSGFDRFCFVEVYQGGAARVSANNAIKMKLVGNWV